ncbi:MAG: copper-containing nitrite reductase [Nitrospinota bacterium]
MSKDCKIFFKLAVLTAGFFLLLCVPATSSSEMDVIKARMTTAPNVPAPLTRTKNARVVVELETKEYVDTLADGVEYRYWSFNGTVPGPMIRVMEGDRVEIHVKNLEASEYPHNIDIHAVNGPGGGAGIGMVGPGEKKGFIFKTLAPGLYIYHCASPVPNIPAHIANGMYGMILVEPKGGMSKVDKEFYVVQGEFFTKETEKKGEFELSMEKGLAETPDHVVFNGKAGALLGNNVLKAGINETIRIYFGNIGPNSISSFHIIGEIFDRVYLEGSIGGVVNTNVQTTLVPAAGTTIVEFKTDVPATLLLVDHSIFRVAKGAAGGISVTGPATPEIFEEIK